MDERSCFVIMPIGDQIIAGRTITENELRDRYTDLIKEAIKTARPEMRVVRSDEVSKPGGISNDVYTRLMHSDFVVADITFPNPNVFYELGLRHACRCGTILLRGTDGPRVPFDVAGHRHLPYENTPTGLKTLSGKLRKQFDWLEANYGSPDSDFQELARLTKYRFPAYLAISSDELESVSKSIAEIFRDPHLQKLMLRSLATGGTLSPENHEELFLYIADKPEVMQNMIKMKIATGGRL
jgi:hypothetical protein